MIHVLYVSFLHK